MLKNKNDGRSFYLLIDEERTRTMMMNTFEKLQELFLHDLRDLSQLHRRRWRVWPMTRIVKEEHLGRCCYLAEEFLTPPDLDMFKHQVGLDERQWRFYKVKISR